MLVQLATILKGIRRSHNGAGMFGAYSLTLEVLKSEEYTYVSRINCYTLSNGHDEASDNMWTGCSQPADHVDARSKARTVFALSNAGVVGSNPT
jgi:hypothetical protein